MSPPSWPFGPAPRPAPPTTPRPVTLVAAAPEEDAYRAKGLHPWLAEEDAVLAKLAALVLAVSPLAAAQHLFAGS